MGSVGRRSLHVASNRIMKGTENLMPPVRPFILSELALNLARYFNRVAVPEVGDRVRVRRLLSPLAGRAGRVLEVDSDDIYGPYLVQFDDGLRFRYQRHELIVLTNPSDSGIK
jgi:hypothetical protein